MVNLSAKDKRIAEAHANGLKNKEIAALEYPDAKPDSGKVLVSRSLKKEAVAQYLEQSKDLAVKELGVTWSSLLTVFSEALGAQKTVVHGANSDEAWIEVLPDHIIRMSAAKELLKYLPPENLSPANLLGDLNLSDMDEVQLNQAIFKRTTD